MSVGTNGHESCFITFVEPSLLCCNAPRLASSVASLPFAARLSTVSLSETILVIEDDNSVRDMIVELLSDEGYLVVAAADGLEALQLVEGARPCVLLLDMMMPGMDGASFISAYHALPGPHASIVIMSASGQSGSDEWLQEIGADALVAKPFDVAQLLHIVSVYAAD